MEALIAKSASVLPNFATLADALDGKKILVSGATGFFGIWLHAAMSYLQASGCKVRLIRLSRSPQAFESRHPEWTELPWASWVVADAYGFAEAHAGDFDLALHMATNSDAASNYSNPSRLITETLAGMTGMLDLCERAGARLLSISSGAVYGKRSDGDGPFAEEDTTRYAPEPLDPILCYGETKRMSEAMCAARGKNLVFSVARPFAFLGPYLPLHTHFAAGNFLADTAAGRPIVIKGDGTALRSYMHPADLICWLLWLLVFGPPGGAVNVGSDQAVSFAELAAIMSGTAQSPPPIVLGEVSGRLDSYLPDLTRAHNMGLRAAHSLVDIVGGGLEWLAESENGNWDLR